MQWDHFNSQQKKHYLLQKRDDYLKLATNLFGPVRHNCQLGNIIISDDGPCTSFERDINFIDVKLSKTCFIRDDSLQSEWELAHECIHILDGRDIYWGTNVMEEGLCTWFQQEQVCKNNLQYPYLHCYNLVEKQMPQIINSIKTIRTQRHTDISDVDSPLLQQTLSITSGDPTHIIPGLLMDFRLLPQ